jgi:hypothetical protein
MEGKDVTDRDVRVIRASSRFIAITRGYYS